MTAIVARGLRKAFGSTRALDGLDLQVEEGRIVGLIGPNGAGKSTAINAILGLTRCEGEIRVLALLAGAGEIVIDPSYEAPKGTPAAVTGAGEVYMPLEGLIDVEAERSRLTKEISAIQIEVKKCEGKLGNASFVDRAPPEVVEQEKARLEEWKTRLGQLGEMLAALA